MNSLIENINAKHESLASLTGRLDELMNRLPSDNPRERRQAVTLLRALVTDMEVTLQQCGFDEQDLGASGAEIPLFLLERQRNDHEELQVLIEIAEAEAWRLHGAVPPIGLLCLLRSLCARVQRHIEHEKEVLDSVEKVAAATAGAEAK